MHTESASKFLGLVLRHKPEAIGLQLDAQGWANIDELVALAKAGGTSIDRDLIDEIVATSDKKRFLLSADGSSIRAAQGHSVSIDLGLPASTPPDCLFHGTATRFLSSIRTQGLLRGSRQHVHLSANEATAVEVGKRHGMPVVLTVKAIHLHRQGHPFFLSANGVWLTASVPAEYLIIPPVVERLRADIEGLDRIQLHEG